MFKIQGLITTLWCGECVHTIRGDVAFKGHYKSGFDIYSAESLATRLLIFEIYQPKTQLCSPAEVSTQALSHPLVVVLYFIH